jgi:hypothetical protein
VKRHSALLLFAVCLGASHLSAQEHPAVVRAKTAYDALNFPAAISAARRALEQRLNPADRALAYEVLAYSYGVVDSSGQAVDAFRELIFLDPDREPDVERVSPRITRLYQEALGRVLVVRRLMVDSSSFVAGDGSIPFRFELSRPSRAITRIVGRDFDVVVDSQVVAGPAEFRWRGLAESGNPVQPGDYQVIVTAIEGRNEFSATASLRVTHSPVDTLPHLTSLPGYTELPELESPPRDWRPLGISVLYAGLSSAATLALEDTDLGGGVRPVILSVSVGALLTGFVMSIKKPDPRPVQANILYNQLLREQVAQRNTERALENERLRRQVTLTITPLQSGGT